MRHRPFPKLAGPGEQATAASPGGTWVALEKIHGAQMVIAIGAGGVRFGKRKAWLADDEAFFGWQLLRAQLTAAARIVASELGALEVFLYGELFGGSYPHPLVPPVPGASAVQTGIWYAPGLHWAIFDVLVAKDDADEGELVAHDEVRALALKAGLLSPPVLKSGARHDAESVPLRFETRVPALFGLPAIDGNLAEGVVVKPNARARANARAIFKKKISEFDEKRFDEAERFDPAQRLSCEQLVTIAKGLVNPARLASARSKVGESAVGIADEVVLDVMVDLTEAFPVAMRELPHDEEEELARAIRALCPATID